MKLHTTNDKINMSGVTARQFKMKASAKAFSILSSTMYKNPILAIVRELACNAYDAHVAAGTLTTPFDVHVPNSLECHFSIRDYGIGLSEQQIDDIYTTYFESTKSDSDDYVGALGLGSKSPFSYADSFTVVSYFHGMKYAYAAFIGSDGIPSIAKLHEEETTEPNGLEVSFAVKQNDIHKFIEATQNFFATWTSMSPRVIGSDGNFTTIKSIERGVLSGDNWFIDSSTVLKHAIVIQGNVPYPVQLDSINTHERFTALSNQMRKSISKLVSSFPLVVVVPIGKLDFAASREELQYTEITINSLIDELVNVSNRLGQLLIDQLVEIESLWEAKIYAAQCRARYEDVFSVVAENCDVDAKSGVKIRDIVQSTGIRIPVQSIVDTIKSTHRLLYNDGRTVREVDHTEFNASITFIPNAKFKLVVNDIGTQGMARIREKFIKPLSRMDATHTYILTSASRDVTAGAQCIEAGNNFAKLLTYDPTNIILTSTLPEIKRATKGPSTGGGSGTSTRTKITKDMVRGLSVVVSTSSTIAELGDEVVIDIANDKHEYAYVVVQRTKFHDPITNTACNNTAGLIRYAVANGIVKAENIIAITPTMLKKVQGKWKSLWVAVADSSHIQNFTAREFYRVEIARDIGETYRSTFLDLVYKGQITTSVKSDDSLNQILDILSGTANTTSPNTIAPNIDATIFTRICRTARAITQDVSYEKLCKSIDKQIESASVTTKTFGTLFEKFLESHPLVRFVDKGAIATSGTYNWKNYTTSSSYKNASTILCEYFVNLK